MKNRLSIRDAGVQATFDIVLGKTPSDLDAGERNFVREWSEYFTEEERAALAVCFVDAEPETETAETKTTPTPVEETVETESGIKGVKALKKALKDLGVKFHHKAGEAKLRELLEAQAHIITQEDADNNPDEDLKVGEKVYLPVLTDTLDEETLKESV